MRIKTLLCAAGVAALATSAIAQSGPVYSLNVVGYANVIVPTNSYVLTANPFNYGGASSPNNYLSNVVTKAISTPSTQATLVLTWNGTGFVTYTYRNSGFSPNGSLVLNPGTAFFIRNQSPTNWFTNTFVGEVMTGTNLFPYSTGYSLVSFSTPVSGRIQTDLGFPAHVNDLALVWNTDSKGYITYTRRSGSWGPSELVLGADPYVGVAQGMFIKTTNANTWTNIFNVTN